MKVPQRTSQKVLWLVSLLVAVSMVCSTVFFIVEYAKPPRTAASPTPQAKLQPSAEAAATKGTSTPTLPPTASRPEAVTVVPPTPVPTASPTTIPATATAIAVPTASPTASPTVVPPTLTATASPTSFPKTSLPVPTPISLSDKTGFSFAVVGDSRDNPNLYKKILKMIADDKVAFLVHTGDLVSHGYQPEFVEFRELMKDFPLPFLPVPGNHDSPDGLLREYLQYTGAPGPHYSFEYGLLHFAMADTHLGDMPSAELAWLDQDLAATKKPVKIVALHYPPWDPGGTQYVMHSGNAEFMALMEKHQVRYVLAGHIHAYDQGTRNGITYVITGGGGAPLSPTSTRPAFYHYLRVKVRSDKIDIEVVKVTP